MDTAMNIPTLRLAHLRNSDQPPDLTIKCGKYTFPVHQGLISTYSQLFVAAAAFEEGNTNVINLKAIGSGSEDEDRSCDHPEAVKRMVDFFYHRDYKADAVEPPYVFPPPPLCLLDHPEFERLRNEKSRTGDLLPNTDTGESDGNVVMHATVYALAVKYMIQNLKSLAAYKFVSAVREHWNQKRSAEAVRIIYTTTPEDAKDLRELVEDILVEKRDLLSDPNVKDVMLEDGGLTHRLVHKMKNSRFQTESYEEGCCSDCEEEIVEPGCDCGRVCSECGPETCPTCG